jgi:hypothetical protein
MISCTGVCSYSLMPASSAARRSPGEKRRRKTAGPHLLAVEKTHARSDLRRHGRGLPQSAFLPGVDRGHDVAGRDVVAIDAPITDLVLDVTNRVVGKADELRRASLAEQHQQRRQVLADGRRQMAGVSAARAEAGEVAFEHDDIDPLPLQRQGGAQPGEAGTDDGDVGAEIGLERRLHVVRTRHPRADVQEVDRLFTLHGPSCRRPLAA